MREYNLQEAQRDNDEQEHLLGVQQQCDGCSWIKQPRILIHEENLRRMLSIIPLCFLACFLHRMLRRKEAYKRSRFTTSR